MNTHSTTFLFAALLMIGGMILEGITVSLFKWSMSHALKVELITIVGAPIIVAKVINEKFEQIHKPAGNCNKLLESSTHLLESARQRDLIF